MDSCDIVRKPLCSARNAHGKHCIATGIVSSREKGSTRGKTMVQKKKTMSAYMGERKLSVGTKAGFGVCDMGGNLFFTAMGFWSLNYLTDTVALPAAAAGLAVMIGKLW